MGRAGFAAGALAVSLACGCSGQPEGEAVLRVLAVNSAQVRVEQELADTVFTPRSGIKVTYDTATAEEVERRARQLTGIGIGASKWDIVHYDGAWLGFLVAAKALERLDTPERLGESRTALEFEDFIPSVAYAVGRHPVAELEIFRGNYRPYAATPVYGLPWAVRLKILFFRQDLLETAGFEGPPQTWAEFVAMARRLNEPSVRHGAVTSAGKAGNAAVANFLPFLWSAGGEIWNEADRRATGVLDAPACVKALSFFCAWNANARIVSPACAGWGEPQAAAALAAGRAAAGALWASRGPSLESPGESKAAGRLGYAPLPGFPDERTGRIRRATIHACIGTGIISASARKREAWGYLKWLLSTKTQQAVLDNPASIYISPRRDLTAYTASRHPRNKAVLDSLSFARAYWNAADYSAWIEILQREVGLAFSAKKDPEAALKAAAAEIQARID